MKDWNHDKAKQLYSKATPSLNDYEPDTVQFTECIEGMKSLPKSSIDLVIADPPFGIGFDGMSGAYNRDETLVIPGYRETQGSYADFTKP